MKKTGIVIFDDEGDRLDSREVFGMGEPMMALFVTNEEDECGLNLNVQAAIKLRDRLSIFIEKHQTC